MKNQKHKTTSITSTETNFGLRQAGIFIGHVKVIMFRMHAMISQPHNLTKVIWSKMGKNIFEKSTWQMPVALGARVYS